MESAFASSAASERFQCVISTGIGAGEISRIAVSDTEGMRESNADYRSVSGLLQQPPPSALPKRERPRDATESEREQSRLQAPQRIRSEPVLRRLALDVLRLTERLIAHIEGRLQKRSRPFGAVAPICGSALFSTCAKPQAFRDIPFLAPEAADDS